MGRIGTSSGSGPDFPTALSDADFDRIETAVNAFEHGRFALGEELRLQISKLVRDYAINRIVFGNEPFKSELAGLLRPLPGHVRKLIAALNGIVAQGDKTERSRVLAGAAEDLLTAHYAADPNEFLKLLMDLHRLAIAAQLAARDCASLRHSGRDADVTLERSIDDLKAVYLSAGGQSVEPSSTFVTRKAEERESRISGFVVFVHECLKHLPGHIYPYRDAPPHESVALAQRIRRHGRKRYRKPKGPRFISDLIIPARMKWLARDRDQNPHED